ncbi:hypothetical protein L6Q79_16040, partial [bacterium]|nr:hypothetical protein [bacterium]
VAQGTNSKSFHIPCATAPQIVANRYERCTLEGIKMIQKLFYPICLTLICLAATSCEHGVESEKVTLNDVWESEFFVDIVEGEFAGLKDYFILNADSTGLYYSPKTHSCHEVSEFSISDGIVLLNGTHYSYYWSDSLRFTMELLDTAGIEGYPFPLDFSPIGSKTISVCK